DFGVQLEFRLESVDRAGADTADVRRNEVVLRTRANLGSNAQLEAYAMSTGYELVIPGLPDSVAAPTQEADGVGLRFSATPGEGAVSLSSRFMGGEAYPSITLEGQGWYPVGPLALEAGGRVDTWDGFSTASFRGGVAFSDSALVPLTARAFGAAGDRGVGTPELDAADSVGFAQIGASLDLRLGPFDLSGRVATQRLDRQLSLGGFLTTTLPEEEVDVRSLEARVEGPLIPVGAVIPGLDPIRVRAWWRQNRADGALPLFLSESESRVELALLDRFFDGNLELQLSGFLERRGARSTVQVGVEDPVVLAADSWPGGSFSFKIGDFRFFWRFTNPGQNVVADIAGATFPGQINVFGIRWEFFN
ncbi:MAG: hypothetical protein MJB57_04265, partial [Gemmatimonadetes bacterium]|nr:hypothetical protein [Gemmatimonadota bacterium]